MKKVSLLSLIALIFSLSALAQTSIELVPTGGYTFPDQTNFYNTYGRIQDGLNWGGSLLLNVNRGFGIELMYNRIDAPTGVYKYGSQTPLQQQTIGYNYIMGGLVQNINFPQSPVHLFFGEELGAAVYSPGVANYGNNSSFAWGLEMGTNIYVNPHVGIRLKGQLLSAVDGGNALFNQSAGGSYYSYYPTYQFAFSAGLIIGLGRILPEPRPRTYYRRPPPPPRYYYPSPYAPPPPGYYYH
jgi:hypothetical protein